MAASQQHTDKKSSSSICTQAREHYLQNSLNKAFWANALEDDQANSDDDFEPTPQASLKPPQPQLQRTLSNAGALAQQKTPATSRNKKINNNNNNNKRSSSQNKRTTKERSGSSQSQSRTSASQRLSLPKAAKPPSGPRSSSQQQPHGVLSEKTQPDDLVDEEKEKRVETEKETTEEGEEEEEKDADSGQSKKKVSSEISCSRHNKAATNDVDKAKGNEDDRRGDGKQRAQPIGTRPTPFRNLHKDQGPKPSRKKLLSTRGYGRWEEGGDKDVYWEPTPFHEVTERQRKALEKRSAHDNDIEHLLSLFDPMKTLSQAMAEQPTSSVAQLDPQTREALKKEIKRVARLARRRATPQVVLQAQQTYESLLQETHVIAEEHQQPRQEEETTSSRTRATVKTGSPSSQERVAKLKSSDSADSFFTEWLSFPERYQRKRRSASDGHHRLSLSSEGLSSGHSSPQTPTEQLSGDTQRAKRLLNVIRKAELVISSRSTGSETSPEAPLASSSSFASSSFSFASTAASSSTFTSSSLSSAPFPSDDNLALHNTTIIDSPLSPSTDSCDDISEDMMNEICNILIARYSEQQSHQQIHNTNHNINPSPPPAFGYSTSSTTTNSATSTTSFNLSFNANTPSSHESAQHRNSIPVIILDDDIEEHPQVLPPKSASSFSSPFLPDRNSRQHEAPRLPTARQQHETYLQLPHTYVQQQPQTEQRNLQSAPTVVDLSLEETENTIIRDTSWCDTSKAAPQCNFGGINHRQGWDNRDKEKELLQQATEEMDAPDVYDGFDFGDIDDSFLHALQFNPQPLQKEENPAKYRRFLVAEVTTREYKYTDPATPDWTCSGKETVLRVLDEKNMDERIVHLRDGWQTSPVCHGDYVNVIGDFDKDGHCVIDKDRNLIILHPDLLISGTSIGESYQCLRKAVLQERHKRGEVTLPLVLGTILHGLFEKAIRLSDFSTETFKAGITEAVADNVDNLYVMNQTTKDLEKALESYILKMQKWEKRYLSRVRKPKATVIVDNQPVKVTMGISKILAIEENIWSPMYGLKGKIDLSVEANIDHGNGAVVEKFAVPLELKTGKYKPSNTSHSAQVILYTLLMEDRYKTDIRWSMLYYMTNGIIRAIPALRQHVIAILSQRNQMATFLAKQDRLPPMLKSRICQYCHQLETCALYHKALENGNAESSSLGALFDEKTGHLKPHHIEYFLKWDRLIELEGSELYKHRKEIWTMTGEEREQTGRCWSNMVVDKEVPSKNGFKYTFKKAPAPSPQQEESSYPEERQQGFELKLGITNNSSDNSEDSDWDGGGDSLLNFGISHGDYVIVSTDNGHFGVATGFVCEITHEQVVISVEEQLRPPPTPMQSMTTSSSSCDSFHRSQVFHGIIDIEDMIKEPSQKKSKMNVIQTSHPLLPHPRQPLSVSDIRWRIDKEELSHFVKVVKQNLLTLFLPTGSDVKRRRLLVDGEEPKFNNTLSTSVLKDGLSSPVKLNPLRSPSSSSSGGRAGKSRSKLQNNNDGTDSEEVRSAIMQMNICPSALDCALNVDQKKAIKKVLSAQDYALILGMPGTGKTTTIAHIVKSLVACGKSVLITSYTHTAVDNLLAKLENMGVDFLRLGRPEQVSSALRKYTLYGYSDETGSSTPAKQAKSVEELERLFNEKQVVGSTCLGITHSLFRKRKFDYCIVDEASQLTQPVCLGPLRFADVFVLVGDHYQLPPLVRNSDAKEEGLGVSLFKHLSEKYPNAVVNLQYQYRMNADIMCLCNELIYNHQLKCGTMFVANSSLAAKMPFYSSLPPPKQKKGHTVPGSSQQYQQQQHWLSSVLDPLRRVIFLNTDDVPAPEGVRGLENIPILSNKVEARLVYLLTDALLFCGVPPEDIGIISPYRSQLKTIRSLLQKINARVNNAIEMHTVDKFQGRDKDCVVISLVRSNEEKNVGELLRDWRRVNVAFTRAKKKLIIVGSLNTLKSNHLFDIFLKIMAEKDWIFNLPGGAHTYYSTNKSIFLSPSRQQHHQQHHPSSSSVQPSLASASSTMFLNAHPPPSRCSSAQKRLFSDSLSTPSSSPPPTPQAPGAFSCLPLRADANTKAAHRTPHLSVARNILDELTPSTYHPPPPGVVAPRNYL
ncbi:Tripartite DNA replication factor [Balamuthia mandrillaris]